MSKVFSMHDDNLCIVSSAILECFLLKAAQEGYILYKPGGRSFKTIEDVVDDPLISASLKPVPEKVAKQLEKASDYLFRFHSSGVWQAVSKCVQMCNPQVIYPVTSFATYMDSSNKALGTALLGQ